MASIGARTDKGSNFGGDFSGGNRFVPPTSASYVPKFRSAIPTTFRGHTVAKKVLVYFGHPPVDLSEEKKGKGEEKKKEEVLPVFLGSTDSRASAFFNEPDKGEFCFYLRVRKGARLPKHPDFFFDVTDHVEGDGRGFLFLDQNFQPLATTTKCVELLRESHRGPFLRYICKGQMYVAYQEGEGEEVKIEMWNMRTDRRFERAGVLSINCLQKDHSDYLKLKEMFLQR